MRSLFVAAVVLALFGACVATDAICVISVPKTTDASAVRAYFGTNVASTGRIVTNGNNRVYSFHMVPGATCDPPAGVDVASVPVEWVRQLPM